MNRLDGKCDLVMSDGEPQIFDGIQVVLKDGKLPVLAEESLLGPGNPRGRIVDSEHQRFGQSSKQLFLYESGAAADIQDGCSRQVMVCNQVEEEVKLFPSLRVAGEWTGVPF